MSWGHNYMGMGPPPWGMPPPPQCSNSNGHAQSNYFKRQKRKGNVNPSSNLNGPRNSNRTNTEESPFQGGHIDNSSTAQSPSPKKIYNNSSHRGQQGFYPGRNHGTHYGRGLLGRPPPGRPQGGPPDRLQSGPPGRSQGGPPGRSQGGPPGRSQSQGGLPGNRPPFYYQDQGEEEEENINEEISYYLRLNKDSHIEKDVNKPKDPLPGSEEERETALKKATQLLKESLKKKVVVDLNGLLSSDGLKTNSPPSKILGQPKNLADLKLDSADMRQIGMAHVEKGRVEEDDDDIIEVFQPPPPLPVVIDIEECSPVKCSNVDYEPSNPPMKVNYDLPLEVQSDASWGVGMNQIIADAKVKIEKQDSNNLRSSLLDSTVNETHEKTCEEDKKNHCLLSPSRGSNVVPIPNKKQPDDSSCQEVRTPNKRRRGPNTLSPRKSSEFRPSAVPNLRQNKIIKDLQKMSQNKLRDLINNPRSGKFDLQLKEIMKEHRALISQKSRELAERLIPATPKPSDEVVDERSVLADLSIDWNSLPPELINTLGDLFCIEGSPTEPSSCSHEAVEDIDIEDQLVKPEESFSDIKCPINFDFDGAPRERIRVRNFAREETSLLEESNESSMGKGNPSACEVALNSDVVMQTVIECSQKSVEKDQSSASDIVLDSDEVMETVRECGQKSVEKDQSPTSDTVLDSDEVMETVRECGQKTAEKDQSPSSDVVIDSDGVMECEQMSAKKDKSHESNGTDSDEELRKKDSSLEEVSSSRASEPDTSTAIQLPNESISHNSIIMPILLGTIPAGSNLTWTKNMSLSEIDKRIKEIDSTLQKLVQERCQLYEALILKKASVAENQQTCLQEEDGEIEVTETVPGKKRKPSNSPDDQNSGKKRKTVELVSLDDNSTTSNPSKGKKKAKNSEKLGSGKKKVKTNSSISLKSTTENVPVKEKVVEVVKDNQPEAKEKSDNNSIENTDKRPKLEGFILCLKVYKNTYIAGSDNGLAYQLRAEKNQLFATYGQKSPQGLNCIDAMNDSVCNNLFTGGEDGFFNVFNIVQIGPFETKFNNKPKKSFDLSSPISAIAYNWGTAYIGTKSGNIVPYEVRNEKLSDSISVGGHAILALLTLKEGPRKVLVVSCRNQPVTIRDAESGLLLRQMGQTTGPTIYSLLFYNNLLFCGADQDHIAVYDFQSGKQKFRLSTGKGIVNLIEADDVLFCASYDGKIYVFDLKAQTGIITLQGPGKMILCISVINQKLYCSSKQSTTLMCTDVSEKIRSVMNKNRQLKEIK